MKLKMPIAKNYNFFTRFLKTKSLNPPGVEKLAAALDGGLLLYCRCRIWRFFFLMCVFTFISLCCVFCFSCCIWNFSTFIVHVYLYRFSTLMVCLWFSVDCWLCICKLYCVIYIYFFQRRVNLDYNCTLMPGVSWNTNKWFNTRAYNTQCCKILNIKIQLLCFFYVIFPHSTITLVNCCLWI